MPTEIKALFHPSALRMGLVQFIIPPAAMAARLKIEAWAKLLETGGADQKKETELLPGFLSDVFESVLGYTRPPADPYTLKREALSAVDGKFADAGIGWFGTKGDTFAAVLEGKGPKDPLDRPYGGRKRSAVEQAALYALQLSIDWYLVTNLRETRLYCKRQDTAHFERFDTIRLARDDADFRRFVFLLGADRVAAADGTNHLDKLLNESRKIGRELTAEYYREYRDLRRQTFQAIRQHNPGRDPRELLATTQKILDRVLFIAFCEDRGLLPGEIIARAYTHADPFNPRPVWENFKGLFKAVDEGRQALKIPEYNGGLFATDPTLDSLIVPDAICAGFKKLADYEYGSDAATGSKIIDVEILGHIFEQSISDLEELFREVAATGGEVAEVNVSKRKREGAFYTPDFVTRYIVAETLGPILRERFELLRARHLEGVRERLMKLQLKNPKSKKLKIDAWKVLETPRVFESNRLHRDENDALRDFWDLWIGELETVRIVDPACGSGAFLIEAFDQMFAAYREAQGHLTELGGASLVDVQRSILTNNLFGMDLNGEAVEIARLSCWIKTAENGKKLTALDHNIVQGNSVIAEPSPLEAWRSKFPPVFEQNGFDVVIANPPYVRQEWISADKPYLQRHYKAFDGLADLYVYFYELGLNLLKPGGRLGFIVTNKWMKAGYGEPLRKLYGEAAWVESVVDLGHNKEVFPDADVFPCIVIARKPDTRPAPETARVCVLPREQTRVHDLSEQIKAEGVEVPRIRFGADPWNLEPSGVAKLMEKLERVGVSLKEFTGAVPLSGIKTGFNDAFLVDTPTKKKLIAADPSSAQLCMPYLRGQDNTRWHAEWCGLWMLTIKSSGNQDWPWSNAETNNEAESIFNRTYPAVHAHLRQYREALIKRQDQGEYWWELRSCAYWDEFKKRKLIYPEITWRSEWNFDSRGIHINNTVYILPTEDLWILAVMNSPVMWAYCWRNAQHGKDEALRFIREFVQSLPIPKPSDRQRSEAENAVNELIGLSGGQQAGRIAFLDWLRIEFGVDKPSQKLQAVTNLDADTLIAEVKKARGKAKGLSVAEVKRLKDEHANTIAPLQTLAREAEQLERRVSDLVNEAFGLTPEEVKLMWDTAPPRMPISPPIPH